MIDARALAGRTFRSLRVRNYRLYFFGQIVSLTGTWMQSVAQAWLVLSLTGSGLALGLTAGLQFGPILFGGPWGGVMADRSDKREVLIAAFGTGVCFLVNAGSFAAVIGGLLLMDPNRLQRASRVARGKGQLRAGLRYVWETPSLRTPLLVMLVVGTLAYNFSVIMP